MDSEQNTHEQGEHESMADAAVETRQSRRKFARNAAVGSAVLLTLGNRVAWGTGNRNNNQNVCISQLAWESYVAGGRGSSAPADGLDGEIERFEQYLAEGKAPTLDESSGQYCIQLNEQTPDAKSHNFGSKFDTGPSFPPRNGPGRDRR